MEGIDGSEAIDQLIALILAAGALGTASFGIVEGLKGVWVGTLGFRKTRPLLNALHGALEDAYGSDYVALLKSMYRMDRTGGDLPRTLRQGVRIGLNSETAPTLAKAVGVVKPEDLRGVAGKLKNGKGDALSEEERSKLGRFELAVDTRIEGALASADASYKGWVRFHATAISVVIAVTASVLTGVGGGGWLHPIVIGVVVGVVAVPVAPVAKDVAKALRAAAKVLRSKVAR